MAGVVYTVGHSTRSLEGFCSVIRGFGVDLVVDVRRWAGSRRFPHFSRFVLEAECLRRGVRYLWLPVLGGYRGGGGLGCFKSPGFDAYALYLLSPEASRGLEVIVYEVLGGGVPVLMCAERLPWRCHRKILADWLVLHGFRVMHIIDEGTVVEHSGTRCIGALREALWSRRGL